MNIQKVFGTFQDKEVLIIGDVMIDFYIRGEMNRISPEAPVPIIHAKSEEKRLGGAANVAQNIAAMGARPILCTVLSTDTEGKHLKEILQKENISLQGIIYSKERSTTIKQRILVGAQHILRIDVESDRSISNRESELLFEKIKRYIHTASAIIFEDYDKGVLNSTLIKEVLFLAKRKGIPTIVDPKKRNFLAYGGCTLFKPNLEELRESINMSSYQKLNLVALREASESLARQTPVEKIMITLSEEGVYITDFQSEHYIPAHKRKICDVSGAGDTVASIAALCLISNLPLEETAVISNLGGGLACECIGVVPINKTDLIREVIKYYR